MENKSEVLEWLGSKRIFPVFDFTDELFEVRLHSASRECTGIQTVLGVLQYRRLSQGLKIFLERSSVLSTVFWENEREGMFWRSWKTQVPEPLLETNI